MRRFVVIILLTCCLLSGCNQNRTEGSSSQGTVNEEMSSSLPNNTISQEEVPFSNSASQEEPSDSAALSETEVSQLFCSAMTEINNLATEDPSDNLKHIFNDVKILDGVTTVNQIPYIETSLPYDKLVNYYGSIFTDDALDWVLSTKYIDINGVVYCSSVGGQSSIGFTFVLIENLQENTYQGTYLTGSSEEEQHTTFSVKETDAGYRISSIGYRPAALN